MGTETDPATGPDGDLRAALYSTVDEAVCFRHIFPPRFDRKPTTFFGGLPLVPNSFVWPSGQRLGYEYPRGEIAQAEVRAPYTFLAQIDCKALPTFSLRKWLPPSGSLLFFMNWGLMEYSYDELDTTNLVLYVPGNPERFEEPVPPSDLPDCYAEGAWYRYPWLELTDRAERGYPKTFLKWPVEPIVVRTYANEHPYGYDSEGRYQKLWRSEQAKEMIAAMGEPVERTYAWPPQGMREVWRPTADFPEAWVHVEIVAGSLLKELTPYIEKPQNIKPGDGPGALTREQIAAGYEKVYAEAEGWVARARAMGLFSGLSIDARAEFWAWLESTEQCADKTMQGTYYDRRGLSTLNKCIGAAAHRALDYCLAHSAEAAALIGPEAREMIRWRHAPMIGGWSPQQVRHQLLGTPLSVQGAPKRFRDTHILLMQFDSDYGMDWMWGDAGVLQYWITREDLRACRFDRVIATLEGH